MRNQLLNEFGDNEHFDSNFVKKYFVKSSEKYFGLFDHSACA